MAWEASMNRTAMAAAALAGVTLLTGASVGSPAAPSPEAKTAHVLKWKWHLLAGHQLGLSQSVVETEVIRSRRTNKIIGYTSHSLRFGNTHGTQIQAAAAVRGGIIVGRLHAPAGVNVLTGRVVSGTGKFKGITGTWTFRQTRKDPATALVTVRVNY
jgi:hypothetical protein